MPDNNMIKGRNPTSTQVYNLHGRNVIEINLLIIQCTCNIICCFPYQEPQKTSHITTSTILDVTVRFFPFHG